MDAKTLARLSYLAYAESLGLKNDAMWAVSVGKQCSKLGLECDVHWNEDNEVIAAWNETQIAFAFRGTTTVQDWAINLMVLSPSGVMPSGGVHAHKAHFGYVRSLDAVWPWVDAKLSEHGTKDLNWTGHSKGGGMASVACSRAWALGYKARRCYTFGEVANSSPGLAELMTSAMRQGGLDRRRYVRSQDIVPRLLPWLRLRGYIKHWGDTYFYDHQNVLRVNHSWWWQEMDRVKSVLKEGIRHRGHHSMPDYWMLTQS